MLYHLDYTPNYTAARKSLATLLQELGAPAPWAENHEALARQRIADAIELAGHPMAPAILKEARTAADQVADPAARAALLAEIEQAATVCAQTSTDEPATADQPASDDPLLELSARLTRIEVWIAQALTTPPTLDAISGAEEDLNDIDDELAELADDNETIDDEAFEGLLMRIGQARRRWR